MSIVQSFEGGRDRFVAVSTTRGLAAAEKAQSALERMAAPPEATVIVEIEEESDLWEVSGYFADRPDGVALALLEAAFAMGEFVISKVVDENWQASINRNLPAVRVGRLLVYGRHCEIDYKDEIYPLQIEASLAFGTGHHATTQMCLAMIDAIHLDGFKVARAADIGSGTGILAMAMASLWKCRVDCSDNDPSAIETFGFNLKTNNLSTQVTIKLADGAPASCFPTAQYDLVTANILSEPLKKMAADLKRLLRPEGRLILSGVTLAQSEEIKAVYANDQVSLIDERQQSIWTTLVFSRGLTIS